MLERTNVPNVLKYDVQLGAISHLWNSGNSRMLLPAIFVQAQENPFQSNCFFLRPLLTCHTPLAGCYSHTTVPESPVELLFRTSTWGHIYCKKELLEINETILITVKGPEDMFTELPGTAGWEALCVDLHEGSRRELAIRTVLLEPLVPLIDGALVVPGVWPQKFQVLFTELVSSGGFVTHPPSSSARLQSTWPQLTFRGMASHRDSYHTAHCHLDWDQLDWGHND